LDDATTNNAHDMLEIPSLIISLFLSVFAFRAFFFLYNSRKYYLESRYLAQQPAPRSASIINASDKSNRINTVTEYAYCNFYDSVRNPFHAKSVSLENCKLDDNLNSNVPEIGSTQSPEYILNPVISLIIATNNEESVIGTLLNSLEKLTYNPMRFEIIIVDDSTDSTIQILEERKKRMQNLRVIKGKMTGSKGAALNLAIKNLRHDTSWVIILDADVILPPDIIEQFLDILSNSKRMCDAIQGYCIPYNNGIYQNGESKNWVSRGVEFRLALRNRIEFVARDKLHLPVQITGSLFMIKNSILQKTGFSTDLCEDWDLTLQLYIRENDTNNTQNKNNSELSTSNIHFSERLNAWNQSPTSFSSYFMQRLRVAEGHTRGFIKKIPRLLECKQSIIKKLEIFLTGFQYLKYTLILFLIMLDLVALESLDSIIYNTYWLTSFSIQLFCISTLIITNIFGVVICNRNKHYGVNDFLSKLFLDVCTLPALILGSCLGILRDKGVFYRTKRIVGKGQLTQ
jgi:cellulose synthase/poly-beta-1,6-N-acetylglucosamine synthase-like glycosyltransferase